MPKTLRYDTGLGTAKSRWWRNRISWLLLHGFQGVVYVDWIGRQTEPDRVLARVKSTNSSWVRFEVESGFSGTCARLRWSGITLYSKRSFALALAVGRSDAGASMAEIEYDGPKLE